MPQSFVRDSLKQPVLMCHHRNKWLFLQVTLYCTLSKEILVGHKPYLFILCMKPYIVHANNTWKICQNMFVNNSVIVHYNSFIFGWYLHLGTRLQYIISKYTWFTHIWYCISWSKQIRFTKFENGQKIMVYLLQFLRYASQI